MSGQHHGVTATAALHQSKYSRRKKLHNILSPIPASLYSHSRPEHTRMRADGCFIRSAILGYLSLPGTGGRLLHVCHGRRHAGLAL